MRSRAFIYALVIGWALVVAWSVFSAVNIEGPRNLDTGFKRLDVLVYGQLIALIIAIVAAVAGFVVQGSKARDKLIALVPVGLTILVIGGTILFSMIRNDNIPSPPEATNDLKPVAPAKTNLGTE